MTTPADIEARVLALRDQSLTQQEAALTWGERGVLLLALGLEVAWAVVLVRMVWP